MGFVEYGEDDISGVDSGVAEVVVQSLGCAVEDAFGLPLGEDVSWIIRISQGGLRRWYCCFKRGAERTSFSRSLAEVMAPVITAASLLGIPHVS